MLVACRLAGLSALEGRLNARAQFGPTQAFHDMLMRRGAEMGSARNHGVTLSHNGRYAGHGYCDYQQAAAPTNETVGDQGVE